LGCCFSRFVLASTATSISPKNDLRLNKAAIETAEYESANLKAG